MKKVFYPISFLVLLFTGFSVHAQVYKTPADTVKLNKEFTDVSNDIASLNAKLTIAQNNMPGYRAKADAAESNAKDAAVSSSDQADKAINGTVREARIAKRKAKRAYKKAKHARSTNSDVGDQDDKIASLTGQLAKKQARLEQLIAMRLAINAQFPQQ
ncbi:MAG: hypothetical protein ABJA78_02905 [Ferruginibacter sp.]